MDRIANGFTGRLPPPPRNGHPFFCHNEPQWLPAESATIRPSLRLEIECAAEHLSAAWPSLKAEMGHDDCLAMESGFDYSNASSARKRTIVNPRGFTANSLFFTCSRKT